MPTLLTCSLLWLQSTAAPSSAAVKVFGAVARPTTFSAAEIAAMPRTGDELAPVAAHMREGAEAIQLGLEDEVGMIERLRDPEESHGSGEGH